MATMSSLWGWVFSLPLALLGRCFMLLVAPLSWGLYCSLDFTFSVFSSQRLLKGTLTLWLISWLLPSFEISTEERLHDLTTLTFYTPGRTASHEQWQGPLPTCNWAPKQSSCISCPSAGLQIESGLPSPNKFHYEKSLTFLFHIEKYYNEFPCTTLTHVAILTLPTFLDEDILSVDRNHLNFLFKPCYPPVNLGKSIFCCSVVTSRFIYMSYLFYFFT